MKECRAGKSLSGGIWWISVGAALMFVACIPGARGGGRRSVPGGRGSASEPPGAASSVAAVGFAGVGLPKPAFPLQKSTYLGVGVERVQPVVRSQFGLPDGTGLVVTFVDPEGPSAGRLQKFDVLTRLNDQILVNPEQLAVLVRLHKPGEKVSLTLMRGGKTETVEVSLGEKELPPVDALFPQPPAMPFPVPVPGGPAPGAAPLPGPPAPPAPAEPPVPGGKGRMPGNAPHNRAPEPGRPGFPQGAVPPPARGPVPPSPGGSPGTTSHAAAVSTVSVNGRTVTMTTVPGVGTRIVCIENGRVVFHGNFDNPGDRERIPPEFRPLVDRMQSTVTVKPAQPGLPPASSSQHPPAF